MRDLPVGPGGGDETCFPDLAGTSSPDGTVPAPGDAFWYLVRGKNACAGAGTYGFEAQHSVPTVERVSTSCP